MFTRETTLHRPVRGGFVHVTIEVEFLHFAEAEVGGREFLWRQIS